VYVTDPCEENNGGCSQLCRVRHHSVRCECFAGYVIDAQDNTQCTGEYHVAALGGCISAMGAVPECIVNEQLPGCIVSWKCIVT
jgi:hypothetical protein